VHGTWESIDLGGKRADVYQPAGANGVRFATLHLHGSDLELHVDQAGYTEAFDRLQLGCVCPHGRRCWWADRLCPEFDARLTPEHYILDHVVPYFKERWGLRPPAIGIQGISMGGQGALRLAFKHPQVFPVVAAVSAALDYHELYGEGTPIDSMYDSKEHCRQDTALMHVPPSHYPPHIFFAIDPDDGKWFRGNDRLHEKLNALGIPHEYDFTTRAGGHSRQYFNHMARRVEDFIHAGLVAESRRLL
jgi:S-formylglutathione hydrolase